MQSLTDALADAANVIHAEATRVERCQGKWRIHYGQEALDADNLALACPAYVAGSLLESVSPLLASELANIPYSSAILVTLVYDRSRLAHPLDGFGFLVPGAERRTITAATWVSTKFPSRVPAGLAALRAFIVAEKAAELLDSPQQHTIDLVRSDLAEFMGIDAAPRLSIVHAWPASMPQYVVGHAPRQRRIAAGLHDTPGLYLIGNAYDGVGIPDCVRLAKETAKQIYSRTVSSLAS